MILVTGATGIAGSQVVRALLERSGRCGSSSAMPDKARSLFGDARRARARRLRGRRASVRAALVGVDELFLSGADDPRRVEWETAAIDAAARAGVQRIVKLSSLVAAPGSPVAFWDWHGRIEQHLRRVGRLAGGPALELLHVEPARRRRAGCAHGPALRAGRHGPDRDDRPPRRRRRRRGRSRARRATTAGTYVLTGPEAITYRRSPQSSPRQPAARSSSSTSPTKPPRRAMIQAGLPAFAAEQIAAIFALARRGAPRR